MSTPAPNLVLTVTLDKDVYAPGEAVTATLTLTQLDPFTVSASGTADAGTANGSATASVQSVPTVASGAPITFGISDSLNGAWTPVSVDANVGTYTETLPAA